MPQNGPEEEGAMREDVAEKAGRSATAKDASVEASGRSGLEEDRQLGVEQHQTNTGESGSGETLRGKRSGGTD